MLRVQAPINTVPEVLRTINRSRYRSPRYRTRTSARSSSLDARKKFAPHVNKSFTCYQDMAGPSSPNRRLRSLSVERSRNISLGDIQPPYDKKKTGVSSRHSNLKSTGRLEEDTIGRLPKDPSPLQVLMDRGNTELRQKHFPEAIKCYKRVLRDDPSKLDAMYNRAVCYMHLAQHKMAIPDLLAVSKENPFYDRQLYIALAMCFVAGGDPQTAIRQLSKGLSKYTSFTEGFLTRGKLYVQLQRWDKAVQDFYRAATLEPSSGEAYLGLADAFRGLGEYSNSIQAYAKAAEQPITLIPALMRRSRLYLDIGQHQQALEDLDLLLYQTPDNAEIYFVKAQTLLSLGEDTEASLAFEQAIKYDSEDKKYTGLAIYHLGLMKIKQRDFYGAMYTFRRARDPKTQFKDQQILKTYAEAVLCLMKRKFKEAIGLLTKLIKKKSAVLGEYETSLYAYRGYGYAALEKHSKAVKDFLACKHMRALDPATAYNLVISQGINASEAGYFEKAQGYFTEAGKLFEANMEPIAYSGLTTLLAAKSTIAKSRAFQDARDCFDRGIEKRSSEAELYFLRAALSYYQDNCLEAIPDLEQAIEKAEDNVPAHYLLRGLCYSRLKLYQEALQDFTIALQLNPDLADAYFYRGRCAYLLEDTSLAFLDFQKLILAKQDDPLVHIHAGNLLMLTGSYEDAVKAFSNANEIKPTALAYIQRCKCRLHLGDLPQALNDATKAAHVDPSNSTVALDREFLVALQEAMECDEDNQQGLGKAVSRLNKLLGKGLKGELCDESYVHFYKGVFFLFLHDYNKALHEFKQATSQEEAKHMTTPNGLVVPHDNFEVVFNLSLCYIALQHYERALQLLEQLIAAVPLQYRGKLILLMGVVRAGARGKRTGEYEDSERFDSEQDEEVAEIDVFSEELNPYSHFPPLSLEIPGRSPLVPSIQKVRIGSSLPKPSPQLLDFDIEESVLDYFTIKAIKCRPEAPWLNRVNGTIQFTEDMQMITSENVSESEEAMLADLKEDAVSPDEGEASGDDAMARKCQSAVYLPAEKSHSGDLGQRKKPTEQLLDPRGTRLTPEQALQHIEALCSPLAKTNA